MPLHAQLITVFPHIVYRETLIETKRISKTRFSTLMTCHSGPCEGGGGRGGVRPPFLGHQ